MTNCPGLLLAGNAGRFDDEALDARRQELRVQNLEQDCSFRLLTSLFCGAGKPLAVTMITPPSAFRSLRKHSQTEQSYGGTTRNRP